VLVVDADRRVRQSLAGLIGITDGLSLSAAVGDAAGAMRALEGDRTDVVLIDPRLPEAELGIGLMLEIHRRWPHVHIVALSVVDELATGWDDPERLVIASPASPEVLVETLRTIDAGGDGRGPSVAR
jgi:DNA-binding NarL/FixJ family response regulator